MSENSINCSKCYVYKNKSHKVNFEWHERNVVVKLAHFELQGVIVSHFQFRFMCYTFAAKPLSVNL